MLHRLVFASLIFLYQSVACMAQKGGYTPELAAMSANARQQLARGDHKGAITTYRQLAQLTKADGPLLTNLGRAYCYSGDQKAAIATLKQAIELPDATDTTYATLAVANLKDGAVRSANVYTGLGLKRFTTSGILYEQRGLVYEAAGNTEDALQSWIDGISYAPGYPMNYQHAAMAVGNGNIWGILWGETYLCLNHDTTGDAAFKAYLLDNWKSYFALLPDIRNQGTGFEQLLATQILQLSPIVSDGTDVETLTMLKTRLMLQWSDKLQAQYKLPLFSIYDTMLRQGWFDIYNEWLFGAAVSPAQHEAWNKFQTGALDKFEEWQGAQHFDMETTKGLASPASLIVKGKWGKKKKR